jgi:hypothetical protein
MRGEDKTMWSPRVPRLKPRLGAARVALKGVYRVFQDASLSAEPSL